jgi:predicted nucleic acid-binding protein
MMVRPVSYGFRPRRRTRDRLPLPTDVGESLDACRLPPAANHPSSSLALPSPNVGTAHNLGAYAAAYIALAEALGCELLTGEVNLKNAGGHYASSVIVSR